MGRLIGISVCVFGLLSFHSQVTGAVDEGGRDLYATTQSVIQKSPVIRYSHENKPVSPGPFVQRAKTAIYEDDPQHLWNRLHHALWVRTDHEGNDYGFDILNPLLWSNTQFLIEGSSHQLALQTLDEFLKTDGDQLVSDPVKRLVLQHDLWSIFDWSVLRERHATKQQREAIHALQKKLVAAMKRLALDRATVEALPNNYIHAVRSGKFGPDFDTANPAKPFLPPDLLDPDGSWVCVRGGFPGPSALAHVQAFNGRSPFLVFIRHPDGRQATLDYLANLNVATSGITHWANWESQLPQFPEGTAVALVRQMTSVDPSGSIIVTPMIQSVQFRVYRQVGNRVDHDQAQATFKFTQKRRQLFDQLAGGLHVSPEKQRYVDSLSGFLYKRRTGKSHETRDYNGPDPFESEKGHKDFLVASHESCVNCHSCGGGGTVNSIFTFNQRDWLAGARVMLPTDHRLEITTIDKELSRAELWKTFQKSWHSLHRQWKNSANR